VAKNPMIFARLRLFSLSASSDYFGQSSFLVINIKMLNIVSLRAPARRSFMRRKFVVFSMEPVQPTFIRAYRLGKLRRAAFRLR